jgi:hypothetical protein
MFLKKSNGIPPEIEKARMSEWYESLSDQNKVKVSRCVPGADTSSKTAFALSVMQKTNEEENYAVTELLGEYIIGETKGLIRYDVLEEIILAYFGTKKYDRCLECCSEGLDMIPEIKAELIKRNGGKLPERIICRNYTINVLVGVYSRYDDGDEALDRFYELGLITEEDLNFRKQSHKVHKLQRVFDGIYSVKLKDQ